MMPHHLRMLVLILAFPLVYFLGFWGYQVYLDRFHEPLPATANQNRIQYPNYHRVARQALAAFHTLEPAERKRLMVHLAQIIRDFDAWAIDLSRERPQFVCLGEDHTNETRRFLAEELFPVLQPDLLMLEATEPELARMRDDSRTHVPLLGADISKVLAALSPATQVIGIEQSATQQGQPREASIAENLLNSVAADGLNVALYGALHCADKDGWLYGRIRKSMDAALPAQRVTVRVLGEHQDGSMEAFVYFLDEIGLSRKHFVIMPTDDLDPWVMQAFPVLYDQTLRYFDAVAVFRP